MGLFRRKDGEKVGESGGYELFFPRTLSVPSRIILWMRGYLDARRGLVQLSQSANCVTSPYCKALVETANSRLNIEWSECNGAMFELRPQLLEAIGRRDELKRRVRLLPAKRNMRITQAKEPYPGDAEMSEHARNRRILRRVILAEKGLEQEEAAMRAELNEAVAQADLLLAQYQECRDMAQVHERAVRIDYLARLSVYARGASRRLNIGMGYVNDNALSVSPLEGNDALFSQYINGEVVAGVFGAEAPLAAGTDSVGCMDGVNGPNGSVLVKIDSRD